MRLIQLFIAIVLLILVSLAFASTKGGGRRATEQRLFLDSASPSVASFPINLGEWQMVEESPLTERTLSILKCREHVNRTYIAESSGERVFVSILLGPAGPMVSHSPEICMVSTQYELAAPSSPVELTAHDGTKIPVQSATLRANDVSGRLVRVYYAWIRPDGNWVAPSSPRWILGGDLGLWKIQVTTVLSELDALEAEQSDMGVSGPSEIDLKPDAAERFLIENSKTMREHFRAYRAG